MARRNVVAWTWVWAELRRRRAGWTVVALLVALTGGTVLASVAGAKRTATALDRFLKASLAADLRMQVEPRLADRLAALPHVEESARRAFIGGAPRSSGAPGEEFQVIAAADDTYLRALDRPQIITGRLPVGADEVTLSEAAVERHGLGVGDRITLETFTPEQDERYLREGAPGLVPEGPAGPTVPLRVVGLVRTWESVADPVDRVTAYLSKAFWLKYGNDVAHIGPELLVRLRDGTAVGEFTAEASRLADVERDWWFHVEEDLDKFEATLDLQALALLLFAACAALAGLTAVAVAVHRQLSLSARDQPVLSALGLDKVGRRLSLGAVALPALVVGSSGAAVLAIAASPLFPRDAARKAEVTPGVDLDGVVLAAGSVCLLLVTGILALLVARRLASRALDRAPGKRLQRSVPAAVLARLPAFPSLLIGARMALERGSGSTALPVRRTLAGVVAGMCGVVGVLTFGASLERLVTTPALFGSPWDVAVGGGEDEESVAEIVSPLLADPRVDDVVVAHLPGEIEVAGRGMPAYGAEPRKGQRFFTIVEGRAPANEREVALGTRTLGALGVGIGDRVQVRAGDTTRSLAVVGTALFPTMNDPRYREGVAFTLEGLDAFAVELREGFYTVLLTWAPGVDKAEARAELERRLGGLLVAVPPPREIANLRSVKELPTVLAGFLALIGLASAAHAVTTSVRRRRMELAVLRALGFVRGQIRRLVMAQANTIALVAVVVGAPLGLVLGRLGWNLLARALGVGVGPVVSLVALLVSSAATVIAVNAVAVLPARAAARRTAASALRPE